MIPPRICIASSGLGHVARGIEAWAQDLGAALAERGQDVLVCQGGGSIQAPYQRIVPCYTRSSAQARHIVERLPSFMSWRLGLSSGYGVEQTTFAWNLIKILRRERLDVLHVQDPLLAWLVQRAQRLGIVRTKTILAHGTEQSLEFLQRITYLQHLAPWHLEEAQAAGVWKPTWTAIPNFIDTQCYCPGRSPALRQQLELPPDAVVVLMAAAIKRHHKRVDYVLGEVAQLRRLQPDLPVWLVVAGGHEADTDEVIREGRELLGERVRFLVRFPREQMPDLYRAADLFVLGSLKEMMPIALLEATASGLPCVIHRHPVMEWMIGPGGLAVDMEKPGSLAYALQRLVLSAPERRALGNSARQHCLANFSKDAVVDQIVEYYRQVHPASHPSDLSPLAAAN